jgi:hypothetical protein
VRAQTTPPNVHSSTWRSLVQGQLYAIRKAGRASSRSVEFRFWRLRPLDHAPDEATGFEPAFPDLELNVGYAGEDAPGPNAFDANAIMPCPAQVSVAQRIPCGSLVFETSGLTARLYATAVRIRDMPVKESSARVREAECFVLPLNYRGM